MLYKLRGQRYKRKTNPYLSGVEYNNVLTDIRQRNWLYNDDMELVSPKDISKYELSYDIYGDVSDKYDYSILGFVEKKADEKREFIQKVNSLDEESQRELVLQLARNLGLTISEDDNSESDDSSESEYFNPNDWEDDEFPERKVNNPDYLIRHVKEQFFCADPKTYQKVWRQICVSKNTKADRAYAIGMYTNSRNMPVCQMCKKTAHYPEVCQIANYGIEMSQLNICLCRECAAKYYTFRDVNKNEFKENMKDKILKIDTYHLVPEYQIELDSNTSISFTQTHIVEIQEIFKLLNEYGAPQVKADVEDLNGNDSAAEIETESEDYFVSESEYNDIENESTINKDSDETPSIDNTVVEAAEEVVETDDIDDQIPDVVIRKIIIEDGDDEPSEKIPIVARQGKKIKYRKLFDLYDTYENILLPFKYPLHQAFEGHKVGDIIVFRGKKYELLEVL